jgi:tetratricopeptide (TPR) repeat protein
MGFRDEFLFTGKTYAQWSLEHTTATGLRANEERLRVLQKTVKSTFERGIDRVAQSQMAASAALQAELAYQADRIGQQILQGSSDVVAAIERGSADIVTAIQQMGDYLGSGLCEIRWAVERHTRVSEEILRVLLNSLDNESRQYFEQGVKCYETSEYEFAGERFNKALEANRTNYFAYQYLGFIAVEKDKPSEAIRNFDLARKFAETGYHQALALSHLARSHYAIGDLTKAAELAKGATNAHPDTAKFWYEFAAYCARLSRSQHAMAALKEAIERDWTYWTVVIVDTDFDLVRGDVFSLLDELRERERRKARQSLDDLKRAIDTAQKVGAGEPELSACVKAARDLEEKYEQNSVFLYRDLLPEALKWHDNAFQIAEKTAKDRIADKKKSITQHETDKNQRMAKLQESVRELETVKGSIERDKLRRRKPAYIGGLLLWWIFIIIIITADRASEDLWIEPAFTWAVVVLALFFFPIMIRAIVDIGYAIKVRGIERRIVAKKHESEFLKKKVEAEYRGIKMRLDGELRELESLLEKCGKRQYV